MSENRNCGIEALSKYDAMTTEELEEILRLDADAPEGQESDTDTLLYIMGVLADRREKNGHTGKTALEAYESFKKYYMPEADEPVAEVRPKRSRLCWLRGLSAAAAVLVILLLGTVTAGAFGIDIWETVVKWTQETFHFAGGAPDDTNDPRTDGALPYASLQEVLSSAGIEKSLAPTWIPDGYQLSDISTESTPLQNVYNALYQNGEDYLKIMVRHHLGTDPEYVEQSKDFVETYDASGITYYLFSNNQRAQAVWITGSYECYIFGNVTIEEIKLMIDSIAKG